jgi:hypothetical protein
MSRIPNRKPDSPAVSAPPVADAPGSPDPAPTPREDGRDENGRFARGNKGGFGNPFARRTAAFRRALAEAVTEEMIAAVVRKLAEMALAGDVAAIKLFLAYTVGKPSPTVNPDTLDVEEYRQLLQEPADLQPLGRMATRPSLDCLLEPVRVMRPGLDEAYAQQILEGIEELDKADRQAAALAAQEATEAPATPEAGEDPAVEQEPERRERGDTMSRKAEGPARRPAQPARTGNPGPSPSDNGDNGEVIARPRPTRGRTFDRAGPSPAGPPR